MVLGIAVFSVIATSIAIFSSNGTDQYEYESIRGKSIPIYGAGLYKHMSADVAIQGIAQDYVTLFIGVPLLLVFLFWARTGSHKARFLLAGVLNYFLITYMFYLGMAMYNALFIVYVLLLAFSIFSLAITLFSFDFQKLQFLFSEKAPVKFVGVFLMITSSMIALLWLKVVIPPLLDGSIIPDQVQHYTTLIVQGFDLGIFLPIAFVSGYLLYKKSPYGYLFGTVTIIFLPLLMTALVAKIIYMGAIGANIFPVIVIIPVIDLIAIIAASLLIKNINNVS